MGFVAKIAKKFTKEASDTVKTEVKKTAVDLLPTILGIASMILGIVIFKETVHTPDGVKPGITNTHITTNNYFFRDMSDEMIEKIISED